MNDDITGLRVGAIHELIHGDMVDPEVRDAIIRAGTIMGELGATVEEVSLPLTVHAGAITAALINVESAMTHGHWIENQLHDFGHSNQIGLLTGRLLPAQPITKLRS